MRAQIPSWSLFPLVQNLCALRGVDVIASAGLAAAIGDPARFATAPDFMADLGLVPSKHSSGQRRRIGAITKAGDIHARTMLIEAAHSYRLPARVARRKLKAVEAVPDPVREIAWKAQTRLCQRYRQMIARDKLKQVVVIAVARELAGFVWAIACTTSDPPAHRSISWQPSYHPIRHARRRAGTGQGNPPDQVRGQALGLAFWNPTSASRQRQARDASWSCGNQPAHHSMINRRSVPRPPPHMPASEAATGDYKHGCNFASGILENGHDSPGAGLVFQRRDAERPLPTVRFRDVGT